MQEHSDTPDFDTLQGGPDDEEHFISVREDATNSLCAGQSFVGSLILTDSDVWSLADFDTESSQRTRTRG
jgi:hypothetical protein